MPKKTKVLIGFAGAVAALCLFIETRSSRCHVERSVTIAAPADRVFAQIDDLRAWQRWSPWEGRDPNLRRTYEGPASGAGARYAWAGNREVGEGRMTIARSDRPREIAIRLEFLEPFAATSVATFTLAPDGAGTRVTWSMDGEANFRAKAIHLLVDPDRLMGPEFARGLASLKSLVEKTTDTAQSRPPEATAHRG